MLFRSRLIPARHLKPIRCLETSASTPRPRATFPSSTTRASPEVAAASATTGKARFKFIEFPSLEAVARVAKIVTTVYALSYFAYSFFAWREIKEEFSDMLAQMIAQGARSDAQMARIDAQGARTDARMAQMDARFYAQMARTEAQTTQNQAKFETQMARIDAQGARTDAYMAQMDARFDAQIARFDERMARIDAQGARTDALIASWREESKQADERFYALLREIEAKRSIE
jgi:hypothetical protein